MKNPARRSKDLFKTLLHGDTTHAAEQLFDPLDCPATEHLHSGGSNGIQIIRGEVGDKVVNAQKHTRVDINDGTCKPIVHVINHLSTDVRYGHDVILLCSPARIGPMRS